MVGKFVVGDAAVTVWLVGKWEVSVVGLEVGKEFVHSDSVLECSGLVVVSMLLLVVAVLYFELEAMSFLLYFGVVIHYRDLGRSVVVVVLLLL